jgi:hypothetical protein
MIFNDYNKKHCNIKETITEHAEKIYSIKYDENILKLPSNTEIKGYLQSYKYFHPHTEIKIKRIFKFSNTVTDRYIYISKNNGKIYIVITSTYFR